MAKKELGILRERIDAIDNEILELLNKRADVVIAVGKAKEGTDGVFYVPSREKAIYERLTAVNAGPFPNDAVVKVFREIISASLNMELPMQVVLTGNASARCVRRSRAIIFHFSSRHPTISKTTALVEIAGLSIHHRTPQLKQRCSNSWVIS